MVLASIRIEPEKAGMVYKWELLRLAQAMRARYTTIGYTASIENPPGNKLASLKVAIQKPQRVGSVEWPVYPSNGTRSTMKS